MHHNNMAGANYDAGKGQSASLVHVINTNTFSHTSSAWSEIVHWSFIWAGIGSQIEITFFFPMPLVQISLPDTETMCDLMYLYPHPSARMFWFHQGYFSRQQLSLILQTILSLKKPIILQTGFFFFCLVSNRKQYYITHIILYRLWRLLNGWELCNSNLCYFYRRSYTSFN